MDLVEISPPDDRAGVISLLATVVILDTQATLIGNGHLGNRLTKAERERAETGRNQAAEVDSWCMGRGHWLRSRTFDPARAVSGSGPTGAVP